MLTWITWLRHCLSVFFAVKLLFFFFLSILLGRRSALMVWGVMFYLLQKGVYLPELFEFLCIGYMCPFSIYLFSQVFIYHCGFMGYLIHTLDCNSILPYLVAHCSSFGCWELFQLVPVSFIYPPHCFLICLSSSLLSSTAK